MMKETIDLFGKILTNILTVLYEPFGFSLLLSFLAMFFYLYAYEPTAAGKGWKSAIVTWYQKFKESVFFRKMFLLVFVTSMMAYVTIPKDLSKVKNKVFLNLTKRQLVCMGFAAGIGVPFYFLMRDTLGTSNAAAGMVLLMLPEFFFALYEKNGMHLETILTNFISVRFKRPAVRRYEVENLYDRELETAAPIQKKGGILGKK